MEDEGWRRDMEEWGRRMAAEVPWERGGSFGRCEAGDVSRPILGWRWTGDRTSDYDWAVT